MLPYYLPDVKFDAGVADEPTIVNPDVSLKSHQYLIVRKPPNILLSNCLVRLFQIHLSSNQLEHRQKQSNLMYDFCLCSNVSSCQIYDTTL